MGKASKTMKRHGILGDRLKASIVALSLVACAIIACSANTAQADIVYSNLASASGGTFAIDLNNGQFGDFATLGGTLRQVDQFQFQIRQIQNKNTITGLAGTLRFYQDNAGAIGSQIGSDINFVTGAVPKNTNTTVTVAVGNLTLPNNVVWTVQFSGYADDNTNPKTDIQIVSNNTYTIGSSGNGTYVYNGIVTAAAGSDGNIAASFSAQAAAVPEPPGIAMTLIALAAGSGYWFVNTRRRPVPVEA
ncbi:MAG: hypothetical protein GC159_00355 [Phycisphaera sp.]|nr:hypothetical protein [Phycisphaera sp.]